MYYSTRWKVQSNVEALYLLNNRVKFLASDLGNRVAVLSQASSLERKKLGLQGKQNTLRMSIMRESEEEGENGETELKNQSVEEKFDENCPEEQGKKKSLSPDLNLQLSSGSSVGLFWSCNMGPPSVGFTRKVASAQIQQTEKERLKREECHRVKHDKLFSEWKVLVGASDWKSHAAYEEGSQRYRLHNLPNTYFGPGVYELGLTLQSISAQGNTDSNSRRIRRQDVIVVYLGQAENVRHRLQTYGQSGSHLEGPRLLVRSAVEHGERDSERNSSPVQESRVKSDVSASGCTERGLRLFTEVFSRGYSIVFRWAKTESKKMAEKVEAELLHFFDYPWNRGLNGARRPEDILARLELMQYQLGRSLCLGSLLSIRLEFFQRKKGIKVPLKRPPKEQLRGQSRFSIFNSSSRDGLPETGSKSQSPSCGVLLKDGSFCSSSPVKGRKRCTEHKGLRATLTTRRPRAGKAKAVESLGKVLMGNYSERENDSSGDGSDPPVLVVTSTPNGKRLGFADVTSEGLVCGVILDGGTICSNVPVKGRKRCADHKGMRIGSKFTGSPVTSDK
ncbi:hypothetical protein R1sor_014631 [Riccia sorocarpa]|uniref:GIY-YIG domain-containing protein n=1 Tax=Riccia sorocarpa TaxID=122646 RepID=A0ABD3H9Z0_9MARC